VAACGGMTTGKLSRTAIGGRILTIRGQRVLLDADLAALYGVTTKSFKQTVRRNRARFPQDFAFKLTDH
jgi:hypothetical protein